MTRVVVVGNGMVGSRFVEDLVRRDGGLDVTVLGAEEYEPYNRVLLSEVVAGKVDVASLALPRQELPGVRVLLGAAVAGLDRLERVVTTADGARFGYDVAVLATGARARVPGIEGLPSAAVTAGRAPAGLPAGLPAGVHALRTLDDAREIVAATVNARHAVVLGGGVLGLEAACGLARRGLHVTVVHRGLHLMDRQLDPAAAAAVAGGLAALGVGQRVGARTAQVELLAGRLAAVRLGDGERLPADLLVLAAGTEPETGLALRAGLEVRRGVVVGADCATADPAVYAIGDCAEPPEGGSGLIAQGWDQARRLAALLTSGAPADGASPAPAAGAPTDVVRVKAHGLDVVTMGGHGPIAGAPAPGLRRVRLSDPDAGRHVEVVVAGGVVVGATCVGAGPVAADLVAAYTRRTPAPADPAQLLLRPVRGAVAASEPSATLMPDRATVCRCNGVTKGEIVASWRAGARTLPDVAVATRATTGCGGCADAVCGLLDWLGNPGQASGAGAAAPVAAGSVVGSAAAGAAEPLVADGVASAALGGTVGRAGAAAGSSR
ncbi:FAD-dependent oxidoreductase [Pengzhenrongella sicca]|uniref:NAD(P)/FAD-dependent oxidoreductase n=1 Tax=Pengzhenrongella sicca TaxID=2819238 RepID=A0A8A4ZCD7_9MICO|nr:FAD-dependent oxidoreductase [Pengzhenrongella sicca]QTE28246.1 NAD(P)/FAD-dependent oxidoreductase [Pengzhenrongella sicca]